MSQDQTTSPAMAVNGFATILKGGDCDTTIFAENRKSLRNGICQADNLAANAYVPGRDTDFILEQVVKVISKNTFLAGQFGNFAQAAALTRGHSIDDFDGSEIPNLPTLSPTIELLRMLSSKKEFRSPYLRRGMLFLSVNALQSSPTGSWN
jgi:hypothetical protein